MAHFSIFEVNSWADQVKLQIDRIDAALEDSVWDQIVAVAANAYDTTTWVDESTTPSLIRKIAAMEYVSWMINRIYSEDEGVSPYAAVLHRRADTLLSGIADGTVILTDAVSSSLNDTIPAFYPNEASSAMPTPHDPSVAWSAWTDDQSVGPSKFSMGSVF